jgi:hypothetical protein
MGKWSPSRSSLFSHWKELPLTTGQETGGTPEETSAPVGYRTPAVLRVLAEFRLQMMMTAAAILMAPTECLIMAVEVRNGLTIGHALLVTRVCYRLSLCLNHSVCREDVQGSGSVSHAFLSSALNGDNLVIFTPRPLYPWV